jgi:hypothetical protein
MCNNRIQFGIPRKLLRLQGQTGQHLCEMLYWIVSSFGGGHSTEMIKLKHISVMFFTS